MKIVNNFTPPPKKKVNKHQSFGSINVVCHKNRLFELGRIIVQNNTSFQPFLIKYQVTKGQDNLVILNGIDTSLHKSKSTNRLDLTLLNRITKQGFEAWIAEDKLVYN